MAKEQKILVEGTVSEAIKNGFVVETDDLGAIICTLSGKIRMHKIRIVPGDSVQCEVGLYDLNRGRITKRL